MGKIEEPGNYTSAYDGTGETSLAKQITSLDNVIGKMEKGHYIDS